MPTETGLALFGVLKQADPALVDPGVTAQLECLLDEPWEGRLAALLVSRDVLTKAQMPACGG